MVLASPSLAILVAVACVSCVIGAAVMQPGVGVAQPNLMMLYNYLFNNQLLLQQQQQPFQQQQQEPQKQWFAPHLAARRFFDTQGDVQFMIQGQVSSGYLPPPQFERSLELQPKYVLGHKVLNRYPHDSQAFTQGLFLHNNTLYESTGLYGQSSLRKVNLKTGEVIQKTDLPENIFGEGITMHSDGFIYGLSWLERAGFQIDPKTLQVTKQFKLPAKIKEGWGITSDGKNLLVSDSTNMLSTIDTNFNVIKQTKLFDPLQRMDLMYANELEFIDGKLFANVYGLDHIAIIEPQSGYVEQWIDCRGLWAGGHRGTNAVFNGVAFNPETKTLLVTGKNWPDLYEIQLVSSA